MELKILNYKKINWPIIILELWLDNDFSKPSYSCPVASNVLTGRLTLPRSTPENEDCLYIKISVPLAAFEDKKPRKVLNYVHGGTFNFGGMDVMYEN